MFISLLQIFLGIASEFVSDDAANGSLGSVGSAVCQFRVASVISESALLGASKWNAHVVTAAELRELLQIAMVRAQLSRVV